MQADVCTHTYTHGHIHLCVYMPMHVSTHYRYDCTCMYILTHEHSLCFQNEIIIMVKNAYNRMISNKGNIQLLQTM